MVILAIKLPEMMVHMFVHKIPNIFSSHFSKKKGCTKQITQLIDI
jgi:hypothetical protein